MAIAIEEIRRSNLFIKSSTDDFQDPVFLTFRVDFFPAEETYPFGDGLTNSCLLKPISTETGPPMVSSPNNIVEYPAIKWLADYYPSGTLSGATPADSLARFRTLLEQIQDSPWYFQSIQGIGDLWKGMQRIKEGNQKTTLTFNCLDSIKQPLTEMAECYRLAVYDQERLSYRLPENLRWFDMVIDLVEIRDIADYSGQFYRRGANGEVLDGIRVLQFRCKMCEFDFSNYLGGSQSDHKIFTEEKPLTPNFNINVGWVIQEKVALSDANDYRKMGMFSGVLGTLNNRISRFVQNATRLPAAIVGSVLNEIQTLAEVKVMGNVYTGVNSFLNDMNNISGDLTGRTPPVGPPVISNVGEDVYPNIPVGQPVINIGGTYAVEPQVQPVNTIGDIYPDLPDIEVSNIGDIYPDEQPTQPIVAIDDVYPDEPGAPNITDMGDTYEDIQPTAVSEIGDIYLDEQPPQPISEIGDIYEDIPNVNVSEIGDIYPNEPIAPSISDMGDIYQDVQPIQIDQIGDVYPDEPLAPSISDMGDTYPDGANTPSVSDMGDTYPDGEITTNIGEIGNSYPTGESTQNIGEIGNTYPENEAGQSSEIIGDTYQISEETEEIDELGDVYQIEEDSIPVKELGDVYPDEPQTEKIDDIGQTYETES